MNPPPVLQSPLLAGLNGIRHGFFTRQGGVSRGLYDSLNVGLGSGDDPDAVTENRRRAAAAFDLPPEALTTAYQIHSATVLTAAEPWGPSRPEADGVVTTSPGVLCGALAADCAPVLIADARARVVGAVHAGWKGALGGVVGAAVAAMVAHGARPEDMTAAIGPCIGPASYEVGADFLTAFTIAAPSNARFFSPGLTADKHWFDLPAFVLSRLAAAGVPRCEWIGRDTCAEPEAFFSNRRAFKAAESDYGRLLSVIVLN